MDTGEVFDRVFSMYRAQATLLVPAALLVFLPPALLVVLGGVLDLPVLLLVSLIAVIVAQFWLQGMVVEAVRDMLDGRRDLTLEALLASATPVLGPLVGAGVLAGLGIAIGLLALVVPGLLLLTIWALIAPVIVVERSRVLASFGRSRDLVRGNGWRVFGVVIVFALLSAVVGNLAQLAGQSIAGDIGAGVGQLLAGVIVAPLSAIAASVMYFALAGRGAAAGPPGTLDAAEPAGGGWAPPERTPPTAGGSGWAPPAPPER